MPIDDYGFLGKEIIKYSAEIEQKNNEYFDFCYSLNKFANKKKFQIVPHTDNDREKIAVCLFIRILEGYQATIILLRHGLLVDAKVILRSIVEALFYLKAIVTSNELGNRYLDKGELERLRILLDFFDTDREHIKDSISYSSKCEIEKDIKKLRNKELSVYSFARDVGLLKIYQSIYRLLCQSVHTDPKELERYLGFDDKGNLNRILWGPSLGKDTSFALLSAAEILMFSLKTISDLFSLELDKELIRYDEKLKNLLEKIDENISS